MCGEETITNEGVGVMFKFNKYLHIYKEIKLKPRAWAILTNKKTLDSNNVSCHLTVWLVYGSTKYFIIFSLTVLQFKESGYYNI